MASAHIETGTANSTTWINLVTLPKANEKVSGVLTGLGVASGAEYHCFRVTIDGAQVVDQFLVGSNATVVSANNGLGVNLPFAKSLLVDVRDLPTASSLTVFWAAYVTDHTEQLGEPETYIEEVDGQQFVRRATRHGTEQESYTIDSLVGPRLWSQVNVSPDCVVGDEPVTGSVQVWREPGRVPVIGGKLDLIVRPAGLTRELDRFQVEVVESSGSADFSYGGLRYELRGMFEIVADLPYTANVPGRYLRL